MFDTPARWTRWLKRSPSGLRLRPSLDRLDDRVLPAAGSWVRPGADGHLVYQPDEQGDRIPDFSNVGYMGGTVPLPVVPVRWVVNPGDGDDGDDIQVGIDRVSALPPDANGFRGAVLLTKGTYQIEGAVRIETSGVVLRGEGAGDGGTVQQATGDSGRTLVQVGGTGSREKEDTVRTVLDKYVPVGARSFRVSDTTGLSVGDTILVRAPARKTGSTPSAWARAS